MDQGEIEYVFDKITISSMQYVGTLKKYLPVTELEKNCVSLNIIGAQGNSLNPYRSQISIVMPTKDFFRSLLDYENRILPYKISYIEVARDTFYPTEFDAENAMSAIGNGTRKKYSGITKFDGRDLPYYTPGRFFAKQTYYSGTPRRNKMTGAVNIKGSLKYVVYARYSKLNGEPCLREEWRISTREAIVKYTQITSLRHFMDCDTEGIFTNLAKRYLVRETFDYTKLGLWCLGRKYRKKLTEQEGRRSKFRGRCYCSVYRIRTFADLVTHFRLEKEKIAKKGRGRKTFAEEKVLSVKNYDRFRA